MIFFKKNIHNPKVHPLSKTVVDGTSRILESHGVTNKLTQARIALDLFQLTIKHMKEIGFSKIPSDTMLERHAEEMKKVLFKHGIEHPNIQENIILAYLDVIGHLG